MRDLLRFAPRYIGVLVVGIILAAILGVYPSLIAMGVIIVLSFTILVMVMRVGTIDDEPLHAGPSASVSYWTNMANKVEARQSGALQAVAAGDATGGAANDEAEKERKRQEALARKAARQSKSTSGEA